MITKFTVVKPIPQNIWSGRWVISIRRVGNPPYAIRPHRPKKLPKC